jgi:hypothetical protein
MTERAEEADVLGSAPCDEHDGWAVVSTGSTSAEPSATHDGSSSADGAECVVVQACLRGHFEPLDGRFHWYGRIAANDQLAALVRSGQTVVLTTRRGSAEGRVSDVDPWGRFRISGTGRPPFW